MKLTIKKKIGKNIYPFTFEGKNLHEAVMESNKLSFGDVSKCGACGDENLILSAHVAQGFEYTEIKCLKCRATLTFGKRKDDADTYFLRRNEQGYEWKTFTPKETKPLNQQQGGKFATESDDLPF